MKENFGLSRREINFFRKLNTPWKIQEFINSLKINFEEEGDTCMSPRSVLEARKAHCIEGAILAAAILRFHGYEPLIVDMEANDKDYDHVIAVYKNEGHWGAITKSNHAVLRFRDPIYRNVRELIMSYFNEYIMNSTRKKTLRTYSRPVNLKRFDKLNWMTAKEPIWFIVEYLCEVKHFPLLTRKQIMSLKKSEPIEIEAGRVVQYLNPKWKKFSKQRFYREGK